MRDGDGSCAERCGLLLHMVKHLLNRRRQLRDLLLLTQKVGANGLGDGIFDGRRFPLPCFRFLLWRRVDSSLLL